MKLLIIDTCNLSLDFALRCQAYGHTVKVFIRNNKQGLRSEVGDGLITRVPDWESYMDWADLIFCTYHDYYITSLEHYRRKGYPIVGPSIDTLRWENDRQYGSSILEKAGVKTIKSKVFSDYKEAIQFVVDNPQRWVCKPAGDGAKDLSYVSSSAEDLIFMLNKWAKDGAYTSGMSKGDPNYGKFILQEFHAGIEMAVGGWFGPGGFSKHFCENWEFKKLMNDDLGVSTGEMGTVLRYVEDSKLADMVLKPVEEYLHGLGYTGYIDVNCIIDDDSTPWPLEFTMRPGWPLFMIQQRLHKGDPAQWLLDLVNGEDTLKVSKNVAIGIQINMPDFPYSNLTEKQITGFPLFNLELEDCVQDIHLYECMMGKAPKIIDGKLNLKYPTICSAGDELLVVSTTASTVDKARTTVYKTIKSKIEVPNSIFYRTDIGKRLEDQLPKLHTMGYCLGLEYEDKVDD